MDAKRAPISVGEVIGGRYRIEALLGDGGMAVVYQARHMGTEKPCALKIIHPHLITRSAMVELFVREAQVGARIGPNPHIVDVFDAGADEARGVPFFAMELVPGRTLEDYAKERGPMPPALVQTLMAQLGNALDQAHRAGIVHRDIKPSNLFLTTDHRGQPLLKVVDFGIAKVLETSDNAHTATQIGTPCYAAPEQLGAGFHPVAQRQGIQISTGVSPVTDVWPMGLVAYELLTGLPPGQYWGASTAAELPLKVVLDRHEMPTLRAGDRAHLLPPGFDAWFARATHKNAAERWPSAGHAAAELGRLLSPGAAQAPFGGPAQAPYPPPAAPLPTGYPVQPPPVYPAGAHTPIQPYATGAMGYGQTGAPTRTAAKQGSSCLVPMLIAGVVALVAMAGLSVLGFRRFQRVSAANACEKEKQRCEEACDRSDMTSCARFGRELEEGPAATRDPTRAAELYQKACDGSDPLGCALLARLHLRGRGGKIRDPSEARKLAEPACDKGAELACAVLGELLRDGIGGTVKDEARARGLFQGACDAGEKVACKDLGLMYKYGRGGLAKDEARAATLFQQACTADDALACTELGHVYQTGGGGIAKDPVHAITLYKQACDGGEPLGCDRLGGMYFDGVGTPKDEARAAALYKQACEGGEPGGCTDDGYMHANGKGGVPQDEARAAALYKQGCDGGNMVGCGNLGVLTELGRGVPKDEAHAATLYKRACDSSVASACANLGTMKEYGKGGISKSEVEAAALYKVACDGGWSIGCSNYAFLLDNGHGVAKDAVAATNYFRLACDHDIPRGCANLGWHYLKGIGLPQDRARGLELLRRSCDGGYSWGCDKLKESSGGLR